jgi:hypothetical protein
VGRDDTPDVLGRQLDDKIQNGVFLAIEQRFGVEMVVREHNAGCVLGAEVLQTNMARDRARPRTVGDDEVDRLTVVALRCQRGG